MSQAFSIMLVTAAISVAAGFMVALLIQVLCRFVRPGVPPDDGEVERIAIALAVAVRRKRKF